MKNELYAVLRDDRFWLIPGSNASESVEVSNQYHEEGYITEKEYQEINRIGDLYGDHHTGATDHGQTRWTPDHMPPTQLGIRAQRFGLLADMLDELNIPYAVTQRFYPHAKGSWQHQGKVTARIGRATEKIENNIKEEDDDGFYS